MRLDARRLERDARRAQARRPEPAIGRETTGVTRAVRDGLTAIRALRAAGVTWAAIAQALTNQGITQAGGRPLTATRLTATVCEVEARLRRAEQAVEHRRQRPDLAPRIGGTSVARAETAFGGADGSGGCASPPPAAHYAPIRSEDEIRRAGLAELRRLLRKE